MCSMLIIFLKVNEMDISLLGLTTTMQRHYLLILSLYKLILVYLFLKQMFTQYVFNINENTPFHGYFLIPTQYLIQTKSLKRFTNNFFKRKVFTITKLHAIKIMDKKLLAIYIRYYIL